MRTLIMLVLLTATCAAQTPGDPEIRYMDDPAVLRYGIEIDTTDLPTDPYVRNVILRMRVYRAQRDAADADQIAMQRRISRGESPHVQVVRVEQWDRITIQLMRIADALEAWMQNYDTGSEARIKQLEKRISALERKLTQSTKDK